MAMLLGLHSRRLTAAITTRAPPSPLSRTAVVARGRWAVAPAPVTAVGWPATYASSSSDGADADDDGARGGLFGAGGRFVGAVRQPGDGGREAGREAGERAARLSLKLSIPT
jgi:hypothetical protein